jgi:hypothetical protein
MKTIKQSLLHYQKGTSNKVYNVYLLEVASHVYVVNFEYGRAGGNLKAGTKTPISVDLPKAEKLYNALVVSKMKKDYHLLEGYDSKKKAEKKLRNTFDKEAYKVQLLDKIKEAGEVKDGKLQAIKNYEVSRLIYRAGELKLIEAKDTIVALYAQNTQEDRAFYYSLAWTLGRYRESSLRPILESLRVHLDTSTVYIIEEALFLLEDNKEKEAVKRLTFHQNFSLDAPQNFLEQVKDLSSKINQDYECYRELDSYYDEKEQKGLKKKILSKLKIIDELYLKLYLMAWADKNAYVLLLSLLPFLPIYKDNFSLFRRLYKMAEFRENYQILSHLLTQLESKKMACYQIYSYRGRDTRSVGCSRLYFKKRSLRTLKALARDDEMAYLELSKYILLSMNGHQKDFKSFRTEYEAYNYNTYEYSIKRKDFDPFAVHITFMYILFRHSKRYMIAPSKKIWEIANKSIKDEENTHAHADLWEKYPQIALEILSKSSVYIVQKFAFSIVKAQPSVIENASLKLLLPLLSLDFEEARVFFFEMLKSRYLLHKETAILSAFLTSHHKESEDFGFDILMQDLKLLDDIGFIHSFVFRLSPEILTKFLPLFQNITEPRELLEMLFITVEAKESLTEKERHFWFSILSSLPHAFEDGDFERLMQSETLSDKMLLMARLMRHNNFKTIAISLTLKEKIASFSHPEMIATTIALLAKLSRIELMKAHLMLLSFVFSEEKLIRSEGKKLLILLGAKNAKNAKILLEALVEEAFKGREENISKDILSLAQSLSLGFDAINVSQTYRLLTAKSKVAQGLGKILLSSKDALDFSVVQWARLAKHSLFEIRKWAYQAYEKYPQKVAQALPKSLMIFDTSWEDTRNFACEYFRTFEPLSTEDIIVIADSNDKIVQAFAKEMMQTRTFDRTILLAKLSQHPSLSIQHFVSDLILGDISPREILSLEYFFSTVLYSVNSNRVAKTRILSKLLSHLRDKDIAQMFARLASTHSSSMVWADKALYCEAMFKIKERYHDIDLALEIPAIKELSYGV